MACGCRGKRTNGRAKPKIIVAKPKVQKRPTIVKKYEGGRVPCPKCGWMQAKVRYRDQSNNTLVERLICPNRKCERYNK